MLIHRRNAEVLTQILRLATRKQHKHCLAILDMDIGLYIVKALDRNQIVAVEDRSRSA